MENILEKQHVSDVRMSQQ